MIRLLTRLGWLRVPSCADCLHREDGILFEWCVAAVPESERIPPRTSKDPRSEYLGLARNLGTPCGVRGKLWEPKQETKT